jgi:hypothetical protein
MFVRRSNMTKIVVIADAQGKFLGAVRPDPFRTSSGKVLRFVAHPRHRHYPIEVDSAVLRLPANELGKVLRERLRESRAAEEGQSLETKAPE